MARLTRRALLGGGMTLATLGAAAVGPARAQAQAQAQEPRFFRIGTGPSDTSYFAAGTLISQVVSAPPGARECDRGGSCGVPGLVALSQTTTGSLANIDQVGAGRLESGLAQADVAYYAFHGTGMFRDRGATQSLRAIANLYREAMHIVVRADSPIRTLADLRGRAVSIGEPLSATRITARAILEAAGIPESALQLVGHGPAAAAEALRNGTIAAYFEMSGGPSQSIADLAGQMAIRLVAIDAAMAERLKRTLPFFRDATIAGDAYDNVGATTTLSLGVLWIVHANVSQETVHGLTRALFHQNNRAALDLEPLGTQIKLETALEGVGLTVHQGAALYYFEAGVDRALVERAGQRPAQP
jgi:uncharacterized protein